MVILNNQYNTGGYAEAYTELVKAFHSLTMAQYASGISTDYYCVQDAATDNTTGGGAALLGGVTLAGAVGVTACLNGFAIF
jgi:hypothetical protein